MQSQVATQHDKIVDTCEQTAEETIRQAVHAANLHTYSTADVENLEGAVGADSKLGRCSTASQELSCSMFTWGTEAQQHRILVKIMMTPDFT